MTSLSITGAKRLIHVDKDEKQQYGAQNGVQFSAKDTKELDSFLALILPAIARVQDCVREDRPANQEDLRLLAERFEVQGFELNAFQLCQLARNGLVQLLTAYWEVAETERKDSELTIAEIDERIADLHSSARLFTAYKKVSEFSHDHILSAPSDGRGATSLTKHSFQVPVEICSFAELNDTQPIPYSSLPSWAHYDPSTSLTGTQPRLVKQRVLEYLDNKDNAAHLAAIGIQSSADYKNLSFQQIVLLCSFILESGQDQNLAESAGTFSASQDIVSGEERGVCRHVAWAVKDVFEVLKGLQSESSMLRDVYCLSVSTRSHIWNAFVWNTAQGERAFQLDTYWEDRLDDDTDDDSDGDITTLRDCSEDPVRLAALYRTLGAGTFRNRLVQEYFRDLMEKRSEELFNRLVPLAEKYLAGDQKQEFRYTDLLQEQNTINSLLWKISRPIFVRLLNGLERDDMKKLFRKELDRSDNVGRFADPGLQPSKEHYERLLAIEDPTARAALFMFTSHAFQDWVAQQYPHSILLESSLSVWPQVRFNPRS